MQRSPRPAGSGQLLVITGMLMTALTLLGFVVVWLMVNAHHEAAPLAPPATLAPTNAPRLE
ncbi:MAG: hypothetical protein NZM11_11170, partial [Anaerolineales bacterium]|nr:hypothetical protein [Anaerolineales bacterium]